MQSGREQLRDWIKRRGFQQQEAAEYLGRGFDASVISAILAGRRSPGLENALTLERLTGIPVEAWVPSLTDKSSATTPEDAANRQVGKA